jgi:succinate dehydrogenase/fumarate reductase flavoprotein subunit
MTTWQEYLAKEGYIPEWPYTLCYDQEQEVDTDVLVIGGGIAGCWAAISAARKGVRVAMVEKGDTIRSGAGGPGCDHWCDTAANPLSKVNPDEWAQRLTDFNGGYGNGIGRQIQCRENWDTLLEMEQMGGKIRDDEGKFKEAEGYDAATKLLISPRANTYHDTNVVIRIWGTTFKPALTKECQRLGVKIFNRVMVTNLLTAGGVQGGKVIGAMGVNDRTGEFMIFKSKATILCTAGAGSIWYLNTELAGYTTMSSRNTSGDGGAMAWRAGAEMTLMERSTNFRLGTGHKHKWYTGAGDASYENVHLVDDNGKELPVVHEPSWRRPMQRGDRTAARGGVWADLRESVLKGEYALPFYGDFPGMPEIEQKVTWNMLLEEESTTKIIVDTYTGAGFDTRKDQLQAYQLIEGSGSAQWREASGHGPIIDWNLMTSLDGLFAAGMQLFSPGDHSFAAATGRYAGRKAADYIRQVGEPIISREQIAREKARVYAPIKRDKGLDWKELHAGIARIMQYFCSEFKTEKLFNIGLEGLQDIEENWLPRLYVSDPHKLMRGLEDTSLLTYAQAILHASLARKASSTFLDFQRIDYPEQDPPEWHKFITLKMENGRVKVGERPLGYWGNMKENYEARNRDYAGVYKG